MTTALVNRLKDEGNTLFKEGEYKEADLKYTKAIGFDTTNPILYTNRALARLRLGLPEQTILDCKDSISLLPSNFKAFYYMAQAQLELGEKQTALSNAKRAYELCSGLRPYNEQGVAGVRKVEGYDEKLAKSIPFVVALISKCKKAVWDARERTRLREVAPLLERCVLLLEKERDMELAGLQKQILSESERQEYSADIEMQHQQDIKLLRKTWEVGAGPEVKKREPPSWLVDDISLSIMRNPVLVPSGRSYDLASLEESLKWSRTDPLARTPLDVGDLRPNHNLRDACTEYLEENGWAIDY